MATFPVLKTGDLLVSLTDIGLPLTVDDIDRPTSLRIIPAYVWFWNHTTSLTLDDVRMAAQLWLEGLTDDANGNGHVNGTGDIDMMAESVHHGVLWQTL